MSGLIDLSGIAVRAYTPGAISTRSAAVKSTISEDKNPTRAGFTDRRLAPAFSIELSLAAQKALGQAGAVSSQPAEEVRSYTQFSKGVGRREVPLASAQRDVTLGSRLNIQI